MYYNGCFMEGMAKRQVVVVIIYRLSNHSLKWIITYRTIIYRLSARLMLNPLISRLFNVLSIISNQKAAAYSRCTVETALNEGFIDIHLF